MTDKSIILIVDDEIVSRHTVGLLLESEGYQLVFAENGKEALLKAEQVMPDVMLLDVMMPEMDGFEVCRRLRQNTRLAELPVVMVTGLGDRESRLRGIEAGADDFMTKPFDQAELRARIRTITRLNRYRRLVETEEKLVYLANYDPLTGLANRHLLSKHIYQTLHSLHYTTKAIAVLCIDLDSFQIINDSLGQALGDELLSLIAQRIVNCIPNDARSARLNGDEFSVALISNNPVKEASQLAQKILNIISEPLMLKGHDIVMTATIGISVSPDDGNSAETLLKHANTAMSRAKLAGKNRYQFFANEMNDVAVKRLYLESQLRRALERDELHLHYQPQMALRSGVLVGAEVLLRWKHPELGYVSPDIFIPLAEEIGLIIPIGEWVLYTACKQAKKWQDQGFNNLCIAVNVSSYQIQHSNLLHTVQKVLYQTQFDPNYLELELTESVLMQTHKSDDENGLSMFNTFKKMGIKIAIDDFGTGYSSLSYLKHFPVDTLKIDKSFINDICSNKDDAAITSTIIAMAHGLQLSVVAEGVETTKQLAFLHLKNCEIAQGYLLSRPLSDNKFLQLLHQVQTKGFTLSSFCQ